MYKNSGLADVVPTLSANVLILGRNAEGNTLPWGTYHYSGQPAISWHGFAEAIFEQAQKLQMIDKRPRVEPITTTEYPTPAERPFHSMLDCRKLARQFGIDRSAWPVGLRQVLVSWKQSNTRFK